MIEIRVEIRQAEGGYIVSAFTSDSRVAAREEIYLAKADAISAATRLHADSLTRCEQWREESKRQQAMYGQQNAGVAYANPNTGMGTLQGSLNQAERAR